MIIETHIGCNDDFSQDKPYHEIKDNWGPLGLPGVGGITQHSWGWNDI